MFSSLSTSSADVAAALANRPSGVECYSHPLPIKDACVTWEREAESTIRSLVSSSRKELRANARKPPLMIAIVGIPGSGKSVGSEILGSFLQDAGCLVFPLVSWPQHLQDITIRKVYCS